MNPLNLVSQPFTHAKNITVGKARIIYVDYDDGAYPEGWVLPGGMRTKDKTLAILMAKTIDAIIKSREPKEYAGVVYK